MKVGLVVNPIAGMGGSVGLKGTDGSSLTLALERGAVPLAGQRARRALKILAVRHPGAELRMLRGELGVDWVTGLPITVSVLEEDAGAVSAEDTRKAAQAFVAAGCDLIVFAGGDGTARDIASVIPSHVGMLGIPCGVKMHSAVFAVSPEAAGGLLSDLMTEPARVVWDDTAEIVDIDEAALRAGRLAPEIYGQVRVPVSRNHMQAAKGGPRRDWSADLRAVASEIVAEMEADVLYIVGPGSSAGAVLRAMGLEPTLLGVDAVRNGRLAVRDAAAAELGRLAGEGPVRLVLGVTGRQGFLLGRGNQQIDASLIARAGREGLIVLGAKDKLLTLAQANLWLDTGDPELDRCLAGYIRVRTGLRDSLLMPLRCAT